MKPYRIHPTSTPCAFSLRRDGLQIALLEGDWAQRLYELLQGERKDLNCYQGAGYILNGTTDFDGPDKNETHVKVGNLRNQEVTDAMPVPLGIQWITKNTTERNPEESLDHLHSAVLIVAGSEASAVVFEIPGYHYAPRIALLAEVHAREMQKANAYQTVQRHFYR